MFVVQLQEYFSTCGSQFLSEILQGMIDDPSRQWQEDELPDITSQSHVCVLMSSCPMWLFCRWLHCFSSVQGCCCTESSKHSIPVFVVCSYYRMMVSLFYSLPMDSGSRESLWEH